MAITKKIIDKNKKYSNNFRCILIFVFIFSFVISYIFAPYHIEGDQAHYLRAYEIAGGDKFIESFFAYQNIIYTDEPIHFVIIWLFSTIGLDKNLVMSLFNGLFSVLFAKFVWKKNSSELMTFWIVVTSYYMYTLFFTLERTKFSVLFILLYLLTNKRFLVAVSILTHSLMIIPTALIYAGKMAFAEKKNQRDTQGGGGKMRYKIIAWMAGIFLLGALVNILGDHIYYKFFAYFHENQSNSGVDGASLVILCGLTLITSNERKNSVLFFLPLVILAGLIGSARINMIGYFGYLYFSNHRHQLFKFGSLLIGFYFIYKSIIYISNIYYNGG